MACNHVGAAVATAKNADYLTNMIKEGVNVKGSIVSSSQSFLCASELTLSPISAALKDGKGQQEMCTFWNVANDAKSSFDLEASTDIDAPSGYFGSSKPLTTREIVTLGEEAANELKINASDKSCVSVTLFHSFGIATGSASALLRGAAVVLPTAGGIRGCGDPKQRAQVTLDTILSTQSTLLFGDTHTMKALLPLGVPENLTLRDGVIKIGSGTTFLESTSQQKVRCGGARIFINSGEIVRGYSMYPRRGSKASASISGHKFSHSGTRWRTRFCACSYSKAEPPFLS
ncbi:hypothetical protein CYMTET_16230 [Cymbomonas tetramitiformis]|uniref:Uncharacterized protein n=1 Tax=Cymbomonas tetramitiformis TaxID=36881 RepID=A0AAE0GCR6_9CHLO|nr:hypothetical protein CYMTET_16230 [Cymbomonas tetramitiformis]